MPSADLIIPDHFEVRFGQGIARRRRGRGMPQAVLAALAEVATREIIVIESEGRNPRLSTVIKLAAGLDLDPWELLEELIWRPHTDTAAGGFLAIEANGSETPLLLAGQPAIRSGG